MDVKDLTLAHVKSHLQVRALASAIANQPSPNLWAPNEFTSIIAFAGEPCDFLRLPPRAILSFFFLLSFGSDKNANAVTPDGE